MHIDRDFVRLTTDRLVLVRSAPEDAPVFSRWRSDPEVARYQGWDITDPEGIRGQLEEMLTRAPGEPGGWVQFSVHERTTDAIVGDVGISPEEREPGVIKVGYTIGPECQGMGYGTEAVRALVGYAFDTLDAEIVRAYADARNTPSIRVAERAGMHLVERIEHPYGEGVWVGVRYEAHNPGRAR